CLLLTVLLALPALPYLVPREDLTGTRFLYLAGAAYVVLGCLYLRVHFRAGRPSRGLLLVGLALAVSMWSVRNNLRLWRQTSSVTSALVDVMARASDQLPAGSTILLQDWPSRLDGIPFASVAELQAFIDSRAPLTGHGSARLVGREG